MIAVAILITDDFDSSAVALVTVTFADAWAVRIEGKIDMPLHFKTQDLNLDANRTEVTLTGMTDDGIDIFPKGNK